MSKFLISICREDGETVHLMPGSHGERDLIDAVVQQVLAKGVGFWRTEAHVKQDLEEAFAEVLFELKSEVIPTA